MNRLKKELTARNIICEVFDDGGYNPYEEETELVGIYDGFLITITYCNVIDPVFHIYDAKTLVELALQDRYKTEMFLGSICFNPWSVGFPND